MTPKRKGRPPMSEATRTGQPIMLRLRPAERAALESVALRDGMTLSGWVRAAALAAAGIEVDRSPRD